MKIIEKLKQKAENNWDAPAVTIAFLGGQRYPGLL